MTDKELIRELLKLRGWSQADLAHEAGFPSQSNIAGLLNNNKSGMRFDNLYRLIHAMGCEIVVKDKMGSGKEWKVEL